MRALVVALAVAAIALRPVAAFADVADYIGKVIASVRLELEGVETPDPKLLDVVETRAGQPLSMMDVRESITHLFSLGRFDNVAVHASMTGDGVALRYELTQARVVGDIEFTGAALAPGIDTGELRRAIVTRLGAAPPVRRAADAAAVVADLLQLRGYLRAVVTPRVSFERGSPRARLVLAMEPGTRTRVGKLDVTGVTAAARQSVLNELELAPGVPFERERLQERIDAYVTKRRARGYFEANVGISVQLTDDDRIADLTLNASPGPLVRVVFAGDPLPESLHDQFVPIEREGSADEDLLEDSSNRIEEYLRAQGYHDAVAPFTRQESNGELRLTFTVKRGPQYRVSRTEVTGNTSVPLGEFASSLRLREGQPFSSAGLDVDLQAIEMFYRRRGFANASAEAAFEQESATADPAQVQTVVRIMIREGVRTTISSVRIAGAERISETQLRSLVTVEEGQPYYPQQIAADRDLLLLQYANLGYQNAAVDVNPGLSPDGTRADIVFTIREGPRILVDHVLIVGNVRTSTDTIARELAVRAGDPLSFEAVNETQRRLSSLGLFRRTRLTELRHGDETTRDVVVTVEEAPVTTVDYGGGVEAGQVITDDDGVATTRLELAPRAFFGISRRNLFGKNRSMTAFARISPHLYESSIRGRGRSATFGFTEYRLLGSFREPRVFATGADASLTAVVEQQRRASFNFGRKSFIAEAGRRVRQTVTVSSSYQIQQTKLFDVREIGLAPADQLLIDRLFPQLRLSSISSSIARDTRDDPVDPAQGAYVSANAQLAARTIGSEVGLGKSFFTAQMFRALPRTNRIVLAGNTRIGLATGFPRDVVRTDANGDPIPGPDGQPLVARVEDLPASERFFAGGDTMRGFALDQLGAPETIDSNGFPIGGNALVLFNAELRVPLRGGTGVVGFVDVGNVFARTSDIDLSDLRTAAGFGVRYRSPIGPIRVDVGFKLRRHVVAGRLEDRTAIHISLGQAF